MLRKFVREREYLLPGLARRENNLLRKNRTGQKHSAGKDSALSRNRVRRSQD